MNIRTRQVSPYAQGYEDYKSHHQCPYEDGSMDAQEWELGWMDSRRDGNRGDSPASGHAAWKDDIKYAALHVAAGTLLELDYTNYAGKRSMRRVRALRPAYWGSTTYHPEPQYLLDVVDLEKGVPRTFAVDGIQAYAVAEETASA